MSCQEHWTEIRCKYESVKVAILYNFALNVNSYIYFLFFALIFNACNGGEKRHIHLVYEPDLKQKHFEALNKTPSPKHHLFHDNE